MALGTPISRGTAYRNYSSSAVVSGSFTPSADALLICYVIVRSSSLVPSSITGHDGGTSWVQVSSTLTYGGYTFSVWGCHTSSSPTSGTVSVSISTTAPAQIHLFDITGADISGTVANSFVQTAENSGYSKNLSLTLTGAADLTIGCWGCGSNQTITPENTTINSLNHPGTSIYGVCDYNASGDASPTATVSGTYGGEYGAWAAEVKVASGGGGFSTFRAHNATIVQSLQGMS